MREVLVFGASGYSGLELLRLLAGHGAVRVVAASSDKQAGERLASWVPGWRGDEVFVGHAEAEARAKAGALAFLATPAESSHELAPALLGRGLEVIDLSGAFRLATPAAVKEWYGFEHAHPALLDDAAYGLPELFGARYPSPLRLVANPGCYATAALLAVAPLVDLLEPGAPVILDGKSGATGAGKKLSDGMMFSEVAETVKPYRLARHQHTPEIERFLGVAAGREVKVSFTAHLLPIRRGLLVSAYLTARAGVTEAALREAQAKAFAGAPFVRQVKEPHPGAVVGTNLADLGVSLDARTGVALAFCAIDNLVKGAAGQAVQNMNAMLGLDLGTGLLPGVAR